MTGWWVACALAQEAPAGPAPEAPAEGPAEAPAAEAPPLLVATVQPATPEDAAAAQRLEAAMLARFARTGPLVPMSAVPDFEAHGYDARTYLLGCPPNRYGGCALVVGQRSGAARVVGAHVRHEADAADSTLTVTIATFHVVDVAEDRELVSVAVPLPEGQEEGVVEGLAGLYADVVAGDYVQEDLRDEDPAARARREEEQRQRTAEALDRLEAQLGTAVRSGEGGMLVPPRMTRADLAAYADRDDTPPWEALGLGPGAYLRFVNSGETLEDWVDAGWGRTTRVLVRIGVGGGPGPWSQRYEGVELLSGTDLSRVDASQLLEVSRSGALAGDFELGFGVAPFLEVAGAAVIRTGEISTRFDQDVEGQPVIAEDPEISSTTTWQYGVRTTFAPFPRWPARPTATAGLGFWAGHGAQAPGFDRLAPPTRTLLELAPGVEISASPLIAPYARFVIGVPIGGTPIRAETGQGLVVDPKPGDPPGSGFTFHAGLQIRPGPIVRPKVRR